MARYRKVDSRIWNDQKFVDLSDDGQLLFLFLLTHPHQTALGAMRNTLAGLAQEKGWLPERLSEAFTEASSRGMVRHDPKASCIWLPNFLKYNRPESPNVVKAWGSAADLVPECLLKNQCIHTAKAFLKGFKKAFNDAFEEVFGKDLPKDYPLSGAGAGAVTGTVPFKSKKAPPPADEMLSSRATPLTLEQVQQLQSTYPKGIYLQTDWMVVEKLINAHMDAGVTFERILASFQRYAAQQQAKGNIGSEYVRSPAIHCDISKPLFDEPFDIPATKSERRTNANLDAVAQAGRELFGESR